MNPKYMKTDRKPTAARGERRRGERGREGPWFGFGRHLALFLLHEIQARRDRARARAR